jgi:hypothetical protein
MRPARIIAAVAVVAAVAVTGCSARSTAPPAAAPSASPAADVTAPPPVATTLTPTDGTDREPVVLADGRHPVLLETVDASRRKVTFDLIQFYQGDAATTEAAKDHQESPPPNDYYIRNVNPKLRTLLVRNDATITVNGLVGTQQAVPVSLARLATLTRTHSPVFWFTVRNGQVVRIAEQWMP